MQTRRDILKGGAALVVAPALPFDHVAIAKASPAPAPPLAWSFDTHYGYYRSTVIARTPQEAHELMIAEHFEWELADDCPRHIHGSTDECTVEDCNCSDCGMGDVRREPLLDDAAARGEITIEDYASAGWGYICDRCGGEPQGGDWSPIDGYPVCRECFTLAEWAKEDPDYYAEMIDELLTDEYGPDLRFPEYW